MTVYHVRHLRAMVRISQDEMARKLRVSVQDVRDLEATPLCAWSVGDVRSYVEALGARLRLTAIYVGIEHEVAL